MYTPVRRHVFQEHSQFRQRPSDSVERPDKHLAELAGPDPQGQPIDPHHPWRKMIVAFILTIANYFRGAI